MLIEINNGLFANISTVFCIEFFSDGTIKDLTLFNISRGCFLGVSGDEQFDIISDNVLQYKKTIVVEEEEVITEYSLLPNDLGNLTDLDYELLGDYKKFLPKNNNSLIDDDYELLDEYQELFYFISQKYKKLEIEALNFSKAEMLSELLLHLSILIDYKKIIPDYDLEDIIPHLKYQINEENQKIELFFYTDTLERCFMTDTTAEIKGTIKMYEYNDIDFSILIVDSKIEVVKFDIEQKIFEENQLFVIEELKQINIQYY